MRATDVTYIIEAEAVEIGSASVDLNEVSNETEEAIVNETPSTAVTTSRIFSFNLKNVLSGTQEGLSIIATYEQNKKLQIRDRREIVKLILDHIFSEKMRLHKNEISEIASQIATLFVTESKVSNIM